MKYYLIAGEASGDLHASNLIQALKERDSQAEFRFLGGDRMAEAAACPPVRHYRDMAYMGFLPVLLHARSILDNMACCRQDILDWNPDKLILVDYAGFNLKVAAYIHKHRPSLPVLYYISPKIWAWKSWRIRHFKRDISRLYIVFPFEKTFFDKHDYPVTYVGNPSVDSVEAYLPARTGRKEWCDRSGLDPSRPILAVLAGSRRQEVRRNLPRMLQAASEFADDYQIVVAGAPGLESGFYQTFIRNYSCSLLMGETYALLSHAHSALVVSGTATLETALFKVPQVVCYRVFGGPITTWIVRHLLIRTPFISLVNLTAGREVVRELVSWQCTPGNIASELGKIIREGPERQAMLQSYEEIRQRLGQPGAAKHTAALMLEK